MNVTVLCRVCVYLNVTAWYRGVFPRWSLAEEVLRWVRR